MRQVVSLSKAIYSTKTDHYQFLAKIQGHTLETNLETEPSSNLSVDQERKVEEHLRKLNQMHRGPSGKK